MASIRIQYSTKKKYRKVQKLKHSTSKDKNKKQNKEDEIRKEHKNYLTQAEDHNYRAKQTRKELKEEYHLDDSAIENLNNYIEHAKRQCDQIQRRVLQGEPIPQKKFYPFLNLTQNGSTKEKRVYRYS